MTDIPPLNTPFAPPRSAPIEACGGKIGSNPEHFIVEEIPAYELSGEGEHVFLWVEKKEITTTEVAKRIARMADMRARDIGYAGMKDRNAITRQWFSLCTKEEIDTSWDLGEGAQILKVTRHKNKLRTGHLIANRFEITLIEVPPGGVQRAQFIEEYLNAHGLPNYFGPQRFGRNGSNLPDAFRWLEKQKAPDLVPPPTEAASEADLEQPEAPTSRKKRRRKGGRGDEARFENKMMPSVLQSEFFNRYTAARIALQVELLTGEVVRLDQAGKHFVVEELALELPRKQSGDLHLTGPMIGPKTLLAQSDAHALEQQIIKELQMTESDLEILGKFAPGARRDLYLKPEALRISALGESELRISFTLPSGAYATQLVREFSGAAWAAPRG